MGPWPRWLRGGRPDTEARDGDEADEAPEDEDDGEGGGGEHPANGRDEASVGSFRDRARHLI